MHDVFEGVCHYNLSLILSSLIDDKYISLDVLNQTKRHSDYVDIDVNNLFIPLTMDNIQQQHIKCFG
jgi:hypothetical protein